jgi:hypothetical protein
VSRPPAEARRQDAAASSANSPNLRCCSARAARGRRALRSRGYFRRGGITTAGIGQDLAGGISLVTGGRG